MEDLLLQTIHDLGMEDQGQLDDNLEASEAVPDWLRQEIESSDHTYKDHHHRRKDNGKKRPRTKDEGQRRPRTAEEQRVWHEQMKRMERENNRQRQELLLQAENAFKMQVRRAVDLMTVRSLKEQDELFEKNIS